MIYMNLIFKTGACIDDLTFVLGSRKFQSLQGAPLYLTIIKTWAKVKELSEVLAMFTWSVWWKWSGIPFVDLLDWTKCVP